MEPLTPSSAPATRTKSADVTSETADPRARILTSISEQFERLTARVGDDVEQYTQASANHVPEGFVIYYLTDETGEPLKNTHTADHGITMADIEETRGYRALLNYCDKRSYHLRIDEHFYSDEPRPTTIYRIVVDGWD